MVHVCVSCSSLATQATLCLDPTSRASPEGEVPDSQKFFTELVLQRELPLLPPKCVLCTPGCVQ